MTKEKTLKFLDSRAELPRLWNAIDSDASKHRIRNEAIFRLSEYCALRISEVSLFKIQDYNPVSHTIYCRRLKNSNNNTLKILDAKVISSLEDYIINREILYPKAVEKQSDILFVSQQGTAISSKMLDKIMRKYASIARLPIDKRHFHVLKHTRAVELGEDGVDIKDIQWWLGHKNINNTMIYMQFTTKQQDTLYQFLLERRYKNGQA